MAGPFEGLKILRAELGLCHAAVMLQGADGGDNNHGRRFEARHTAFNVHKLLRAEIRAEARLRHGVLAKLQRHAGGCDTVAAVCDVGKGAAVDESGVPSRV